MKAVVYEKYGSPDVLELKDIPKPVPKDKELLVKIISTTVTAGDWRMRKADPFLARLFNGLFKPSRVKILGFDLAGVVEEVGSKVSSFKKGDEVFAWCGLKFGAYAEYKCVPEDEFVAIKPANISFDEAAAAPTGGLTALRFLRSAAPGPGQEVLIYGASGSVGTYAVQIAKNYGTRVTAVCSTDNVGLIKSLGADEIIDYKKQDFTKISTRFDVLFDAVGKTSKSVCKPIMKPGAKYVSVSGSPKTTPEDMLILKQLLETGKIKSVIDRKYTLEQIREAHTYVEGFRKKGNVVVGVA
jgi:NADPH:quinone reductase-like Zn-dependent oxidoreductase